MDYIWLNNQPPLQVSVSVLPMVKAKNIVDAHVVHSQSQRPWHYSRDIKNNTLPAFQSCLCLVRRPIL